MLDIYLLHIINLAKVQQAFSHIHDHIITYLYVLRTFGSQIQSTQQAATTH